MTSAYRNWRERERRITRSETFARAGESAAALVGVSAAWLVRAHPWITAVVWLLLLGRAVRYVLAAILMDARDRRAYRAYVAARLRRSAHRRGVPMTAPNDAPTATEAP